MSRKKRGFRRFAAAVLFVVLTLSGGMGYVLARPLPEPTLEKLPVSISGTQAKALAWPAYGESAVGAMGYGLLASNGNQTPIATASTAKVLTALSVLKQKPLQPGEQGPTITIGQADIEGYNSYVAQGGSVVPVNFGEQISEYQALQAVLLPSANNMADTLARWAFGSVEAYLSFANGYAKQLGLESYQAADDASGFSAATVASAADLTRLGLIALQNPVIAEIAGQSTATIPVAGQIKNVNFLLGSQGVIGIKTGNNDADPGAFLFAVKRSVGAKQLTIIGAVMGAPNLRTSMLDALTLADSAVANFSTPSLIANGIPVARYHVPWQTAPINAVTASSSSITIWGDEQITDTTQLNRLSFPAKHDSGVGVLLFKSSATKQKTAVALKLEHDVPNPSLWWRLRHAF